MQLVADIKHGMHSRFRYYEIKRSQITIAKYRNSRSIIGYAKSSMQDLQRLDETAALEAFSDVVQSPSRVHHTW